MRARLLGATAVALALCLPAPAFAVPRPTLYVSAFLEGSVRAYTLKPDGTLGEPPPGAPYALAQSMSEAAIISPDGRRLYVTDRGEPGQVDGFSLREDGGLTPLPGSPYPTDGNFPVGLAFSPDGAHLYATNYNAGVPYTGPVVGPGSIKAFAVRGDGSLESAPGAKVTPTGGLEPIGIVTTPDGRFAYVTHNSSGDVAAYAIQGDGSLRAMSPIPTGSSGADGIAVSPDGSHLYVDTAASEILTFALDGDGHARRVGAPASTGGQGSIFLTMTRDGGRLWASNLPNGTITGFEVGSDGVLRRTVGPTPTGGELSQAIALSADERHLYVSNRGSSSTSGFAVAPDGTLTPLKGSPFPTGNNTPGYSGLAATPGYSPTARLTARRLKRQRVRLSAAATSDPDGSIAKIAWDFGDGQRAETPGPAKLIHRFRRPGRYRVTVVATDDIGCSTEPRFTGRTAACAGAAGAQAERIIVVKRRKRHRR